ncbi:hypothetical protein EON78_03180 [bacterium]|nr:MAG: hypothetical protein EON78_03180 [bacterium]
MQICPSCSTYVIDDAENCSSCGVDMNKILCPACSTVLDIGADMCDSCGQYLNRELFVISNSFLKDVNI